MIKPRSQGKISIAKKEKSNQMCSHFHVCIVAHIASTSSGRKIYLECEGFERESMNLNLGKSWQRRFGVAPWDENTIAIYEFPV